MSDNLPANIDNPILTPEEEAIEASRAPLMEHLTELRTRLFWSVLAIVIGFGVCFSFWSIILEFLLIPYKTAAVQIKGASALKDGLALIYTAPMEPFFAQMDIAIFGGIILAFPIIAYQAYRFIAPGLYSHEKYAFLPFLIMSPILFAAGAAMAYYVAMPMIMNFSLRLEVKTAMGVDLNYQGKISDYIHLITTIILGFGLCFQIPVIQAILSKVGIISGEAWIKSGRFAILGIITLSAFITPPDIMSQLLMSAPLIVLYYGGAMIAKLIEPKYDNSDNN
jgi:sec-independent protein translocase protein TatC